MNPLLLEVQARREVAAQFIAQRRVLKLASRVLP